MSCPYRSSIFNLIELQFMKINRFDFIVKLALPNLPTVDFHLHRGVAN